MNLKSNLPQTAIVYLSGAGLNPNIWDNVRAKAEVPSVALTYNRDKATTLNDAVQDALTQTQKLNATRYAIVAHSLGGVVGVELSRKLGGKMAGFVAVSATIPAPGESFASTLPFPQSVIMPIVLKIAGTKPPAAAIRKGLCNDLNDEQTAGIVGAFTPEPIDLYVGKTSASPLPPSKYLYVRTIDDKQTLPSQQARMAKQLPAVQVVDIASGHLAMISHPDELAAIINDFVAGFRH
ncbi:MAG TPA: alpha/beta hydrolase [Candidatus Chromulinivoraceae bacterium]|nr:alpha/beta hydrolase [Candidatus Chromulinivoraceae bacterium]